MRELTESKEQGQILLGIVCRKSMHIHIMASLKDLDTGQRRRQRRRVICLSACIMCITMNFLQHGHEWRSTTSGMRHPLLSLLFLLSIYLPLPSLSISLSLYPPLPSLSISLSLYLPLPSLSISLSLYPPLPSLSISLSLTHKCIRRNKNTMHICICACAITHTCIKGDAGSTRFIF